MDCAVFMSVEDELRPFLQPGRSPRGLDVFCVEKQLAMTCMTPYFLKDQGSLMMKANTFGVANYTVSLIVQENLPGHEKIPVTLLGILFTAYFYSV